MNFLNKLERKIGRYAIPNLIIYLIIGYAIGYLITYVDALNPLYYLFMLDPASVMKGQVWRLITWVIMPPGTTNIFFYLIMMLFYYQLGMSLERAWGSFRFNVYIFGGILFTDIGVMLGYYILAALGNIEVLYIGYYVSTYYINMAIFLAFAMTYPENKVMLWFVIPIKMKWLAIVYAAFIVIDFVQTGMGGRIVILASMLNFIIFFLMTRNMPTPSEIHRRNTFRRAAKSATPKVHVGGARHKCAICGKTEISDPDIEFRYCSKCMGNYEYCSEHLFTHTHVR